MDLEEKKEGIPQVGQGRFKSKLIA